MENFNTTLSIIVSILTIIGLCYSVVKWLVPHAKIKVDISYERKTSIVSHATINGDYVDHMINTYFDGPKSKMYQVTNIYNITIEADRKLRIEFISANSPTINLQFKGQKLINLDDYHNSGQFQVYNDGGIVNGYPHLLDEHKDLTIIFKYVTLGIISHYVKHTSNTKQFYSMP